MRRSTTKAFRLSALTASTRKLCAEQSRRYGKSIIDKYAGLDEAANETDNTQTTAAKKTTAAAKKGGSGGNPYRHPLAWQDPLFYDEQNLEHELRRVFDVCHGCRRCFNLCNSFPRLFDIIDKSPSGDLDTVPSDKFKEVSDDCTLCDMCFLTKCPYVPPHALNVDFPHLILRYRALEHYRNSSKPPIVEAANQPPVRVSETTGVANENIATDVHVEEGVSRRLELQQPGFIESQITRTDRNGVLGTWLAPIANRLLGYKWARSLMQSVLNVDAAAHVPRYAKRSETAVEQAKRMTGQRDSLLTANSSGPSFGKRKVVLFATCLSNYNKPDIALAAAAVLARNGVEVVMDYQQCCGMPQLEEGRIDEVAKSAQRIAGRLHSEYVSRGFDVVTVVSSCALMLKGEWPAVLPHDPTVAAVSAATYDICEYVVSVISKNEGLAEGLQPLPHYGKITQHHACHARAQNVGNKGLEMLRLVPGMRVAAVQACSGHGGSWGCRKSHFETALKVGKPVARAAMKNATTQNAAAESQKSKSVVTVASECPLAAEHILQGAERLLVQSKDSSNTEFVGVSKHPIEILAESYGIVLPTAKSQSAAH